MRWNTRRCALSRSRSKRRLADWGFDGTAAGEGCVFSRYHQQHKHTFEVGRHQDAFGKADRFIPWRVVRWHRYTTVTRHFQKRHFQSSFLIGCKLRQRYLADVDIGVRVLRFHLIWFWKWCFWKRHGTISKVSLQIISRGFDQWNQRIVIIIY